MNSADTGDQCLRRQLLWNDGAASRAHRLGRILHIGRSREHDDSCRKSLALNSPQHVEQSMSVNVEDHDVGLVPPQDLRNEFHIVANGHHVAIGFPFEDVNEATQRKRMVAGQNDADSAGQRGHLRRNRDLVGIRAE